ncbi:exonuclease domain-containing protein, partial [Effusibacillus lacus]
MKLDRSGVFRRFLQSKAAGILPLAAGTAQGDMHAEALIRGMLQEARPEETWNAPLLETRFVVADTETTGFNPNTDAIIAVGAVEMEGNRILAERTFHKFVHLGSDKRVPPVVTKLTGIRNEDLADAPPITEVLQQFLAFVKDGVLVMHHSYHDV